MEYAKFTIAPTGAPLGYHLVNLLHEAYDTQPDMVCHGYSSGRKKGLIVLSGHALLVHAVGHDIDGHHLEAIQDRAYNEVIARHVQFGTDFSLEINGRWQTVPIRGLQRAIYRKRAFSALEIVPDQAAAEILRRYALMYK